MFRADDQIVNQTFGNGLVDQRVYTARGLLSNWDLTGRKAHDRDYSYDDNGNQLGWNSNSTSAAYQYDALDRLIDEQQGNYHNAYSYDANGNRLSQLLPDGSTKAYSYAPQSNRMTQNGRTAVRLDAAGNTLDDGKYQYRYDAASRLAEVQQGGQAIASYRYDYQGLRRQKITAEGTTDFTYDTSGHLISQQTKGSQDNGQRDYLWTDTAPIARIDGPIGQAKVHKDWLPQALMGFLHRHEREEHGHATQLYYFHTDAMGTPRLATDAKQQVVWRWNEDAFGAKVSTDQVRHGDRNEWGHRDLDWDHGRRHGIQVNLRYPGQYYDSETGLFYNWNRYYDPSTGRYATSDPIGLSGGANTYAYVEGNPLRWADQWGLIKLPSDPSGLPSNWHPDPSHLDPNGERWTNGKDFIDFHKGRPGLPGWRGKDHWHHNGDGKHWKPGDECPTSDDPSESDSLDGSSNNNFQSGPPSWAWMIIFIPFPGNPIYGGF